MCLYVGQKKERKKERKSKLIGSLKRKKYRFK